MTSVFGLLPLLDKFGDAFRGVKLGVRGHSSFFVHFFCAALVLAAAVVFHCDYHDWCLLILCIGLDLSGIKRLPVGNMLDRKTHV